MQLTSELKELRLIAGKHRPDTCEIQSYQAIEIGDGGWVEDWVTLSTVDCRIRPAGTQPEERLRSQNLQIEEGWVIALPFDAVITTKHRLKIGNRLFTIRSILAERSYQVEIRVLCVEVPH